jgi:hypothetical protein
MGNTGPVGPDSKGIYKILFMALLQTLQGIFL